MKIDLIAYSIPMRIKILMAVTEASTNEVCEACDVSRQAVALWREGLRTPSPENIQKLTAFFAKRIACFDESILK